MLQDAQDKIAELGVAKPSAEKLDLDRELVVGLCSVACSPFPQSAVLQHCLKAIHNYCVLDLLPLVSRQDHAAFLRCFHPLTVTSVRQRFKERVDIDSYENKPVPQMPE